MKKRLACFFACSLLIVCPAVAQYQFLTSVSAPGRVQALWSYCTKNAVSDKDSAATYRFYTGVMRIADSLHDTQLRNYAFYFRMCLRPIFSVHYQQYFAAGDYESPIALFLQAKAWAEENHLPDIAAACEHNIGEVYFGYARYGLAFEHLLKADEAFRKIGYAHVPAAARYLYDLAADYYRFNDYSLALNYFLQATHYPFYEPWAELSTLHTISRMYARQQNWGTAISYYQKTVSRAKFYHDTAWLGIAAGNYGNICLSRGRNDSALFYSASNYRINTSRDRRDASKSALSIATALVRLHRFDSVPYYIRSGESMAAEAIHRPEETLEYKQRLLGVQKEWNESRGDYKTALLFSDSLITINDSIHQLLNDKILARAVEKTEAQRYETGLQLLESQKKVTRFRYSLLVSALVLAILVVALLFYRYRLYKTRQVQRAQQNGERMLAEKRLAEEKLRHAGEALQAYVAAITEKTAFIESLHTEIRHLREENTGMPEAQPVAVTNEQLLSFTILTDADWQHFLTLFEKVHAGFLHRLQQRSSDLSKTDTRLLVLTRMGMSSREMAAMLNISVEAIRKARYRLRKKLNLDGENALEEMVAQV